MEGLSVFPATMTTKPKPRQSLTSRGLYFLWDPAGDLPSFPLQSWARSILQAPSPFSALPERPVVPWVLKSLRTRWSLPAYRARDPEQASEVPSDLKLSSQSQVRCPVASHSLKPSWSTHGVRSVKTTMSHLHLWPEPCGRVGAGNPITLQVYVKFLETYWNICKLIA